MAKLFKTSMGSPRPKMKKSLSEPQARLRPNRLETSKQQSTHEVSCSRSPLNSQQELKLRKDVATDLFIMTNEMVSFVKNDSPFLRSRSLKEDSKVALVARDELILGDVLGKGAFSCAYELVGFQTLHEYEENLSKSTMFKKTCGLRFLDKNVTIEKKKSNREHFKASLRSSPGKYAIKFTRPELLHTVDKLEEAMSDLVLEANFLSKINHPNILKIRGVSTGGTTALKSGRHDSFFIITDKLDETLTERLVKWEEKQLSHQCNVTFKLKMLLQIADALDYLHERRLIYRDLKPDNVGLIGEDQVQIFDFGFCRELPGKFEAKNVDGEKLFKMSCAGSARYMAPEVRNTREYNAKADVYSWSILAYEVLSGKHAFQGKTLKQHTRDVLEKKERPSLLHCNFPSAVKKVISMAWEHNCSKRISMRKVCDGLQIILSKLKEEEDEATSLANSSRLSEVQLRKQHSRGTVPGNDALSEASDIISVCSLSSARQDERGMDESYDPSPSVRNQKKETSGKVQQKKKGRFRIGAKLVALPKSLKRFKIPSAA